MSQRGGSGGWGGCPSDSLKLPRLLQHDRAKPKVALLQHLRRETSPPTSSPSHSSTLLYLSDNPLIKADKRDSLLASPAIHLY